MRKTHSQRHACGVGQHFLADTSWEDSDVNCKNCIKIINKRENREAKVRRATEDLIAPMSNEILLDETLSLEPDDYDGGWTEEGRIERDTYAECLKLRLADWINE